MERTQAIYKAYKKQRDRADKLIKSLLVLAFINTVLSLGNIFVGSSVLTYTVWVLLTVWAIGEIVYLVIQHTSSNACFAHFNCDVNYLSDINFAYRYLDYDSAGAKCHDLGNFYALLNLINDFVNTPIEKRYPE